MTKAITPEKRLCRCGCGKTLTPNYVRKVIQNPRCPRLSKDGDILRISGYGYSDNGHFQTLRCGFRYAVKKLKANNF